MDPLVTVIIPTFNSEKTIGMVLESVKNQTFDQQKIEIVVVDGGSVDKTRGIANQYHCTILENPQKLPEYAKHIGITYARSQYAVFLDSDEVLLNKDSFLAKVNYMEQIFVKSKNIITSGLKNPFKNGIINNYINSFGDPFSFFVYNIDGSDYKKSLIKNNYKALETSNVTEFFLSPKNIIPICDSGGHFFDLRFLKKHFDTHKTNIIPQIFTSMVSKTGCFAICENDFTAHYTTTHTIEYLKKIRTRVLNNIFLYDSIAGFSSRESAMPIHYQIRKFFFMIFSLTIVPIVIYSIARGVEHKKPYLAWLNPLLAIYTSWMIIFYSIIKAIRYPMHDTKRI